MNSTAPTGVPPEPKPTRKRVRQASGGRVDSSDAALASRVTVVYLEDPADTGSRALWDRFWVAFAADVIREMGAA